MHYQLPKTTQRCSANNAVSRATRIETKTSPWTTISRFDGSQYACNVDTEHNSHSADEHINDISTNQLRHQYGYFI